MPLERPDSHAVEGTPDPRPRVAGRPGASERPPGRGAQRLRLGAQRRLGARRRIDERPPARAQHPRRRAAAAGGARPSSSSSRDDLTGARPARRRAAMLTQHQTEIHDGARGPPRPGARHLPAAARRQGSAAPRWTPRPRRSPVPIAIRAGRRSAATPPEVEAAVSTSRASRHCRTSAIRGGELGITCDRSRSERHLTFELVDDSAVRPPRPNAPGTRTAGDRRPAGGAGRARPRSRSEPRGQARASAAGSRAGREDRVPRSSRVAGRGMAR